ncbi:EF-hand domain-containing protein [Rhizobium sp. GN54]|uniref:EF-hand domain-containing protein n=1 Tax=Rhizobium sp. GN54 TaxID=2898150 RepID=UPI001E5E1605|nr:EF-hand domain-containing protein [Rhizobium sp. GN54]MCD2185444.1 EF-hand domain-containing protein [Rhizobium sp. GN54]
MIPGKLTRITTAAAILLSIGPATAALAQSGTDATQSQGTQTEHGQMPGTAMGGRMQGMMGGMPMAPMRGHMMKIMFAVADTDGDGGLSFEEVTAVHKRIFDSVDANDDGKVTLEEMQTFMQGQ